MALTVVNKCRPTNIGSNPWCVKDLFSKGEGTNLIALPTNVWGQIKDRWISTPTAADGTPTPPMVLAGKVGTPLMEYIYNAPTQADPETVLFPTTTDAKTGLYFSGNALIFNPTAGNAIEADGTPYQNSMFSLPVGSSKEYDELVQYMQSKAWVLLKLNNDNTTLHVYGGPRGYFPKPDEVAEMLMSGNNDAKGKTSVNFEVSKAAYSIEYLSIGAQTTDKDALAKLFGYIQEGVCMDNGTTTA